MTLIPTLLWFCSLLINNYPSFTTSPPLSPSSPPLLHHGWWLLHHCLAINQHYWWPINCHLLHSYSGASLWVDFVVVASAAAAAPLIDLSLISICTLIHHHSRHHAADLVTTPSDSGELFWCARGLDIGVMCVSGSLFCLKEEANCPDAAPDADEALKEDCLLTPPTISPSPSSS